MNEEGLIISVISPFQLIDDLNGELDFLKDQITTTEVNMAHLHNYRVKQRQAQAKLMGQA